MDENNQLEQLQECIEGGAQRDRILRAKSRSRRRFIAAQPKRLVELDAMAVPGQAWAGPFHYFADDLPRAWVCRWDTERQVRFGAA